GNRVVAASYLGHVDSSRCRLTVSWSACHGGNTNECRTNTGAFIWQVSSQVGSHPYPVASGTTSSRWHGKASKDILDATSLGLYLNDPASSGGVDSSLDGGEVAARGTHSLGWASSRSISQCCTDTLLYLLGWTVKSSSYSSSFIEITESVVSASGWVDRQG